MVLIASRGIGNAGTMEIHDDGSTVLMRIRSADSGTYSGGIPCRVFVGGGWSGWFGVPYSTGSPWVNVWAGGIGSSQSVAFAVGDTGTWGFGGGGELWASIGRATVPPAPTNRGFENVTATGMTAKFEWNGDGGSGILRWEYQCSTAPDPNIGIGIAGNGVVTRNDFKPATEYFWRFRGVNAVGAGAWSPWTSQRTLSGAYVGKNGQFPSAPTTVGKSGQFVSPIVHVGKSGSFVNAL